MFKIPTKPNYYVKATDGASPRITLALSPRRAAELMAADIERFDVFRHETDLQRALGRA